MTAFVSEAIEVIKWIGPYLMIAAYGAFLFWLIYLGARRYTDFYRSLRVWPGITLGILFTAVALVLSLFFLAKFLDPTTQYPWWTGIATGSSLFVAVVCLAIIQALEKRVQTLDDQRINALDAWHASEQKYRDLRQQAYPDPESDWEEQILQQFQARDQAIREARDEIQTLKRQLDNKEDELEKINDRLNDTLFAISKLQRMSDVQIKPISTPSPWVVFDIADALEEAENRQDMSASPNPQGALESGQRKLPAPETKEAEDQTSSEDEIDRIWRILDEMD